jgi:hypothetical protein
MTLMYVIGGQIRPEAYVCGRIYGPLITDRGACMNISSARTENTFRMARGIILFFFRCRDHRIARQPPLP